MVNLRNNQRNEIKTRSQVSPVALAAFYKDALGRGCRGALSEADVL